MTSVSKPTKSTPDKLLAELIKRVRSTNELTQISFGQLFQPPVTQSTIARWENGEQMPDKIHFPKIAYFLDSTQEELEQLIENPPINVNRLHIEKKIFAPNKKHLNILKRGVTAWNKWREKNPEVIPVLAGIELSHFDLDKINLDRADLRGIKLSNISSNSSSYKFADLRYAYLNQVYFFNSDLSCANISQAEVRFTYFDDAKLVESDFDKSNLLEVHLNSANLSKANLNKVNLINADLRGANCTEASFENSSISNSSIFGASFLEAKLDGIKLENIYISPNEKKGLSINDLLLAQNTYLQRYDRSTVKKIIHNFQLEEEAINLANILADKYGNYSHTEGFYVFNNYQADNQSPPFVEARREGGFFHVVFYPDYTDQELVSSGKAKSRTILQINDDIIESNFEPEDIDVLRELVLSTEELQNERVNQFIPIALKALELKKSDKFVCEDYIIEIVNEEIMLFNNSEHKIELMRIKLSGEQWEIIRSSLSNKCIMCFQKLLLDLLI